MTLGQETDLFCYLSIRSACVCAQAQAKAHAYSPDEVWGPLQGELGITLTWANAVLCRVLSSTSSISKPLPLGIPGCILLTSLELPRLTTRQAGKSRSREGQMLGSVTQQVGGLAPLSEGEEAH